MAEKNHAYQPFMAELEDGVRAIVDQIKGGGIPESLRHLPAVEPRSFKRKRRITKKAKK